jgi:hypothetical protein
VNRETIKSRTGHHVAQFYLRDISPLDEIGELKVILSGGWDRLAEDRCGEAKCFSIGDRMGTLAIGDFTSESEDMFFDSSVITRIQQLVVT